MSNQTYGFQQMLARQRPPQPTAQSPCPSCHQPAGNAAAIAAMQAAEPEPSWLNGADLDTEIIDGSWGRFGRMTVDTGIQDGGARFGTTAAASLWEGSTEYRNGVRLEGSMGKAAGEITGGADGVTVGGGLTGLEIALDGTKGDPDRIDPMLGRFGLGVGAGAGFRVHRSDKDGDGRTECGSGFDLGPITADLTSEVLCPEAVLENAGEWWSQE